MAFFLGKKNKKTGTWRRDAHRRRRGSPGVFMPWIKRICVGFFVVVLLCWGLVWISFSGAAQIVAQKSYQIAMDVSSDAGLTVRNMMVEGRVHSDAAQILSIVGMKANDPLLMLQPAKVKENLERMPWIASARVERRMPDTIYIRLTERVPTALWRDGDSLKLLDENGGVIQVQEVASFKNKMIVTGEGAPEMMPDLLKLLSAEPLVMPFIRAANRVGNRRWDLYLKDGMVIRLPEHDAGLALRNLAAAQEKDTLFARAIAAIDLREPGRLVIRPVPGAAQEYKANLKSGSSI